MKYYTSEETELVLGGDTFRRIVPTRLALLHDPRYLKATQPPFHIDVMVDLINRGRPLPVDETWSAWTSTASRFMDQLYAQPAANVAETLALAARAVDVELTRERQRYQRYSQAGVARAE
jgi:hypothetical protein